MSNTSMNPHHGSLKFALNIFFSIAEKLQNCYASIPKVLESLSNIQFMKVMLL